MKKILTILMLLVGSIAWADSPIISLITCGETDEHVFYLYGHTALRVQNGQDDLVYNYGYFSPSQKHFILNFVLGKPMYSLGVISFQDFLWEYEAQGRSVVEQELNLKPEEAQALMEQLMWNALPENRDYQYNFYFDNCATRPRDLIDEAIGGIEYHMETDIPTFRQAIRNKSHSAVWYTIGCDICLGWKTDQTMSVKDAAFLPSLLEEEMDSAVRADNDEPLVIHKKTWVPQTEEIYNPYERWYIPYLLFSLLIIIFFVLKYTKRDKALMVLRKSLYAILGIAGIIVWFLGIVSAHPHTWPNVNMLFFHPLWLILFFVRQKKSHRRALKWLYFGNFVAIIMYLLLGTIQVLPLAIPIWAVLMLVDQWFQWSECKVKRVSDE